MRRWYLIAALPALAALWVWFSPLSFVPVPWPDDSAFYFVARELFRWPPRWVMLPQAPFEPTYRIWNFNTMPLYPLLIGLVRLVGIDGIWALKILPLGFWAASGVVLTWRLLRAGLPWLFALAISLVFAMDPTLRWGSVLVRPESLIGLFGMLIVLDLSLPPQGETKPTTWRNDKIAILLALAAYAHFNAVHLVFPVLVAYVLRPKRILQIAGHTTLYLVPWLLTVFWHFKLFLYQMDVQWYRLSVPNLWLASFQSAITGMFQSLGSPEPWRPELFWASYWLWALIFIAALWPAYLLLSYRKAPAQSNVRLAPAAAWVLSAFWLWNSKPEVWFTYYLHESIWCFCGVLFLSLWSLWKSADEAQTVQTRGRKPADWIRPSLAIARWTLFAFTSACALLFLAINLLQAESLGAGQTWNWTAYHDFIDCIDRQLIQVEADKKDKKAPLEVWDPTFPDVTVELSRRHPAWDLTRTNDFGNRWDLAYQHGNNVDAVVITEMLNWPERQIDSPMDEHPEIQSVWMNWKDYPLHNFLNNPSWKLNRHLCQVGRWQSFIYIK
jgi:hypothetical protein